MKYNKEFDPESIIAILDEALRADNNPQDRISDISFLKARIRFCKILLVRPNDDGYTNNLNFYFVDPKNPNQPGSAWLFKKSVSICGRTADVNFDIMEDDSIGSVEIWYHPGFFP